MESFVPAEAPPARGTVRGHASLYWEDCYPSETCQGAGWPCGPTEQSCAGTCFENTSHPGCGAGGGGGGSHPGLGVPCSATCYDQEG
ncbi:MAG TPA: hypothetical protein VHG91_17995 [Longimicrobium sp.]|nr:hypothetical protein [Longimicrobium sp.]